MVDTFDPPTMADERTLRPRERLAERVELGDKERTGAGDGGEADDAMGRSLGTVRGAEGVHHVDVARRGHAPRQGLVVGLLPFEETHVLAEARSRPARLHAVQPVLDQPHITSEQLPESARDRGERERGIGRAFPRQPEVRHHHHPGAGTRCLPQRRKGGPEPGVAGDRAVLDGDVQILADEHAPAREVQIGHGEDVHPTSG